MKRYDVVSYEHEGSSFEVEGVLFFYDDLAFKRWEVQLFESEDVTAFEKAYQNRDKVFISFKSREEQSLTGNVIVTKFRNVIELEGTGPIHIK